MDRRCGVFGVFGTAGWKKYNEWFLIITNSRHFNCDRQTKSILLGDDSIETNSMAVGYCQGFQGSVIIYGVLLCEKGEHGELNHCWNVP